MLVFPGSWLYSWSKALALSPSSSYSPWPQSSALVPNFHLSALTSNLYLPALTPNLYISSLVYNLITSLGPEFLIYRFLLVFMALNYDLYYQSGAWIWIYLIIGSSSSSSCNSSSNNFFGIDNTIICMSILINEGKQTEVSTETGC